MPIRPRKEFKERISGELTGPMLEDLILGYCFFDEPFKSEEAREKCWKKNREHILNLQGKPVQGEGFSLTNGVYFGLFERPSAWWKYDSPEPRGYISCGNDFCPYFNECLVARNIRLADPPCVIRPGENRKGKSSFEGRLKIECVGNHFRIYEPERENEKDFLIRCNLLNEKEAESIKK